jgi:hypothetical protein
VALSEASANSPLLEHVRAMSERGIQQRALPSSLPRKREPSEQRLQLGSRFRGNDVV